MDTLRNWFSGTTAVQIAVSIIGIVVILIAVRLARRAIILYVEEPAARYRARKLVTLGAYMLMLLVLSLVFRTRLAGLTIFFGAAGAGITIALREVILSVAGWLTITFGGLYSAGDRIQIAGVRGDVIDVSILRTTVMEIGEWVEADLYTGRTVRVSNSFVFQQPVFNYSGDFPFLWDEVRVPIKYGCDRALVREILTRVTNEVVADYTIEAKEDWRHMLRRFRVEPVTVEPVVTLIANDNWLEFTARYVVSYKRRRLTKDAIYTQILDEFDKTDGRVRIASQTHDIVGFPDITVDLRDGAQRPNTGADG